MAQDNCIEDAIINLLPNPLLWIILEYNPVFAELKSNELKNIIDWSSPIKGLFNIQLGKLKPEIGYNNFVHFTTVNRHIMTDYTLDLVREYRIAKTSSLIKQVIAGDDYYILWMTDNTIRIHKKNNGCLRKKEPLFNQIDELIDAKSIISNNYYTLVRTNNGLWCIGKILDEMNNSICWPLLNVPNNIIFISGDKYNLYLLLTDGSVVYLKLDFHTYEYDKIIYAGYSREFIPFDLICMQKCTDIISLNKITLFQFAGNNIFTTVGSCQDGNTNDLLNLKIHRNNILKFSNHFLLVLDDGSIYWDSPLEQHCRFKSDVKMANIKKIAENVCTKLTVLFFLMVNGDLYYIIIDNNNSNTNTNTIIKYPISNVEDIMCFDNIDVILTRTDIYDIQVDGHVISLVSIDLFKRFASPISNFIGSRIRLLDGTIIGKQNGKFYIFSDKINIMDHYDTHGDGSFICVAGNNIFFESCLNVNNIFYESGFNLIKVETFNRDNLHEKIPCNYYIGDIISSTIMGTIEQIGHIEHIVPESIGKV